MFGLLSVKIFLYFILYRIVWFDNTQATKDDIYALFALTAAKRRGYNESSKLHTRTMDTGETQAPKM